MTTWEVRTNMGFVVVDADYHYVKDGRQLCLQNKGEQYPIAVFNDWLYVTESQESKAQAKENCCE